ncbi:hypothetical protein CEUSTIGMA_g3628.t1 [Chlamydomonas eustigma]|uniref:Uncharacterized protein n=1 Tax=Chlamydomonas eustigma TaxID=1157962 RepID=A0A250WZB1_9CHLO|nr:hypothetical protein CEUSTIGMA_g3628.t1 [Chlamydomonas eustigma]|eukprot:GAX76184.1 hypothetical protein CEUSTIGMA_g3628.t1 [Chlamydomonas eustigma]
MTNVDNPTGVLPQRKLMRMPSSIDRLKLQLDSPIELLIQGANRESPTFDIFESAAFLRKTQSFGGARPRRSDPGHEDELIVKRGFGKTLSLRKPGTALGRSLSSPRNSAPIMRPSLRSPSMSASSRMESVSVAEDPKEGLEEEEIVEDLPEEQEGVSLHYDTVVAVGPNDKDADGRSLEPSPFADAESIAEEEDNKEEEEADQDNERGLGESGANSPRGSGRKMTPAFLRRSVGPSRLNRVTSPQLSSKSMNHDHLGDYDSVQVGEFQEGALGVCAFEEAAAAAIAAIDVEGKGKEDADCDNMQPGERPSQHMMAQRSLSRGLVSKIAEAPRCNPWAPLAGPGPAAIALQHSVDVLKSVRGSLKTMDSMRGRTEL